MIDAVAAVFLFSMGIIWNREDWMNLCLKIFMFLLSIALGLQSLVQFGFLIRI